MIFCHKIFLSFLLVSSFLLAQESNIQFEHLSSQDGLASNTVFSILQDNKGFIWFGTYDGLDRYDGYKFTHFQNIENDSTSISDNKIRAMCKDDDGNLWIGTWNDGLNKLDPITEKFTRYKHNPDDPTSLSSNNIISLRIDKTGNLWIGTIGGGLNQFDVKNQKFYHYKNDPDNPLSLSDNSIYSLYEDRNGTLWIGTNLGGLNRFNKESNTFTSFKRNPDDFNSISSNYIASIFEDKAGNLWIGTANGKLDKFEFRSGRFEHHSGSSDDFNINSFIWTIIEDVKGNLWIGTDSNGLVLYDRQKNQFFSYKQISNDPKSLSDNTIVSAYTDRSGILWLGTWNSGINKLSPFNKKFSTLVHNPDDPNSLSGNSIFPIYEDSYGDLWIGTDVRGLNRMENGTNKIIRYLNIPNDPYSVSGNGISSICEDGIGNLWIGTNENGLNQFDRKNNKFIRFKNIPGDPASISKNAISRMFLDSKGNLWIGTGTGGLNKLQKNSTKFIHYTPDPDNPKSIMPQTVFAINEDRNGKIWVGSDGGGLSMLDENTQGFIHFKNEPGNFSSLSHNSVSVIYFDKLGNMWIGTNGGGLNKYIPDEKKFIRYKSKDGLPDDMICGILEDDHGNLWISTYKGLSKFNPQTVSFRNFGVEERLQGNEFNNWAFFKRRNGIMYFGGTNGLSFFHPDSLRDNLVIPPIVITDFQLMHKPVQIGYDSTWGRTILSTSINETKQVDLHYDDNIISFEFSALDFNNPDRNQYAYFLEGFDKSWTHTNANRRVVTYTNLEPGEYTLRIKGSNNDGIWNEAGTSLKIIISPPWWSSWWSYILYGFILVIAFTISTRIYLNRQRLSTQLKLEREHAEKLEEVDKMKSNFYANISHEFRTPLMLILGPAEKLISKLKDDDGQKQIGLIKGNAKRLLNLINQLLDLSRLEAGRLKLNASLSNISQFVKGLAMEFESVAEQRDITLKIIIEKEDIEAYFDREKMEKIITNLLSNAFKFTPAGGRITVVVKETILHQVEIVVRDSGIGIPKAELSKIFDRFYQVDGSMTREHEGSGIGLALTKELVELHKGNIFIDSVEGHWTEVKISIPLGKEHLSESDIIEPSDYQLRKVDSLADYLQAEEEAEETISEHLIDKTIVLIVEDNPDVREFVKDALKATYHVEEAANGEQGLRKAEKIIPDLIISDIMMPRMDGYELTKKLRQDERTSHIPIILLTAKSDKDSKLQGLGLGADDYLIKPFDSDELLARIKNLIETRKMLQQKFGSGTEVLQTVRPAISCLDEQFLNRIMLVIEEHLSEEQFSIEEFGKDVGMSRSQIHRKLKALTGKSTSVYLRTVRLAKAKQMIEQKKGNISDICYAVGFSSPAYFSRCFKEEFGYAPSEHSR